MLVFSSPPGLTRRPVLNFSDGLRVSMDARIGERSDAVFADGYARGITRVVAIVLYRFRETRAGTPVAAWRRFLYWKNYAPVAQLDRALPSEGRGQGFESLRARH